MQVSTLTSTSSFMSWDNGQISSEKSEIIGYSIRMSMDDCTATLVLRSDEPITNRIMINALVDLAKKIETECEEDYNGDH